VVTLPIEPPVHRHAADLAFGLQLTQERGGNAFLLSLLAQVARRRADRFANLVRVERPSAKRVHHRLAQLGDFSFRDAELERGLEVARRTSARLERQREVGGGNHVSAASRGGQLVDAECGDGCVDRFA